jgi:hypothetical protein
MNHKKGERHEIDNLLAPEHFRVFRAFRGADNVLAALLTRKK